MNVYKTVEAKQLPPGSCLNDLFHAPLGSFFWGESELRSGMKLPTLWYTVPEHGLSDDMDHKALRSMMLYTGDEKKGRPKIPETLWWWDGNKDKPTTRPSIGAHPSVDASVPEGKKKYSWHGYLTNGVFKACE